GRVLAQVLDAAHQDPRLRVPGPGSQLLQADLPAEPLAQESRHLLNQLAPEREDVAAGGLEPLAVELSGSDRVDQADHQPRPFRTAAQRARDDCAGGERCNDTIERYRTVAIWPHAVGADDLQLLDLP